MSTGAWVLAGIGVYVGTVTVLSFALGRTVRTKTLTPESRRRLYEARGAAEVGVELARAALRAAEHGTDPGSLEIASLAYARATAQLALLDAVLAGDHTALQASRERLDRLSPQVATGEMGWLQYLQMVDAAPLN